MATIHDVAAQAGVSVATVSRVLNDNAAVNAEMAARVRAAIAELDYRPSHVARSMRTQRTSIVAVVVPDVENPFFTSVVRGIEDVARAAGLLAVLCNSDDQPDAEMRYLRLVEDQRVDGVILASAMSAAPEELVRPGKALPPLVLIDREVAGIKADVVLVDNKQGAREATEHLLDGGARTLACITGPEKVSTAEERLAGFLAAASDRGIPRRDITFRHADFRSAGARAALRDILTSTRPDALLVCNNQMTLGALQELADGNVRIPHDLLLAGYDDEPWSGSWKPSITSVAQPAREVGKAAMRLMLDRLEEPNRPTQRITMQPSLVIRESSQRAA
ncbi:MAG TPA: LacI family DNA-binding transcriptional regulator [Mycobacteriales bacterium]|nr:LacI family DNA-binding transcriptional regulator [Mycobacteriales bacterium]